MGEARRDDLHRFRQEPRQSRCGPLETEIMMAPETAHKKEVLAKNTAQTAATENLRPVVAERSAASLGSYRALDDRHHVEALAMAEKSERILRRPEVERVTGLSRSSIYEWMRRGEFPQPVALGARLVGWRQRDIAAWIAAREPKRA